MFNSVLTTRLPAQYQWCIFWLRWVFCKSLLVPRKCKDFFCTSYFPKQALYWIEQVLFWIDALKTVEKFTEKDLQLSFIFSKVADPNLFYVYHNSGRLLLCFWIFGLFLIFGQRTVSLLFLNKCVLLFLQNYSTSRGVEKRTY